MSEYHYHMESGLLSEWHSDSRCKSTKGSTVYDKPGAARRRFIRRYGRAAWDRVERDVRLIVEGTPA